MLAEPARLLRSHLHLGLVVRVGELRVQNEAERRVVLDLLVAHLDRATLLDGVAADDWIKHRVDGLVDVLDEHCFSHGHCALDHVQVVLVSETHGRQTTGVSVLQCIQYNTIQYNEKKLMFPPLPLIVDYHEGAMMSCSMPNEQFSLESVNRGVARILL